MGLALLELYRVTGEKIWLDEAKRYAGNLAKTQLESGTWTWVEEKDASIGVSNNRHDRSWDNVPYTAPIISTSSPPTWSMKSRNLPR